MQPCSRLIAGPERCASLKRALLTVACACLASGCDVGSKPEPPYKDPPPNQRIKSQVLQLRSTPLPSVSVALRDVQGRVS